MFELFCIIGFGIAGLVLLNLFLFGGRLFRVGRHVRTFGCRRRGRSR